MFYDDALQIVQRSAAGGGCGAFPDEASRQVAQAADREQLSWLERADLYWLDVRLAERFKAASFDFEGFPPLVHESFFVEFNGLLRFDYAPVLIEPITSDDRAARWMPSGRDCSEYRGVLVYRTAPPHRWKNWPPETVYRALWFERRHTESVSLEGRPYEQTSIDYFSLSFCQSSWPRMWNENQYDDICPAEAPAILRHGQRLFRMTVNLMYFLSAENVIRVRIRPEHHRHAELKGLPHSARPYHVLPFQVPAYRYMHREFGPGHPQSCAYDVRGHFRHLWDERFQRNPDGTVRVIWIEPHIRGVGRELLPAVRRGTIDGLFLDYDKFIQLAKQQRKAP